MTIIHHYIGGHGDIIERVQVQGTVGVTLLSCVMVSAAEFSRDTNQTFIGSAKITVCNVSPGPGFVDIWVNVAWDNDLTIQVVLLLADV